MALTEPGDLAESRSSRMRRLLAFSLPLMGGNLSSFATLIVDSVMCSHISDGGLSLTALGFAVQLWFLLDIASEVVAVGTVAAVSRAHGAGDMDRVNRLVAQSAQLALLSGAAVGIIGAILSGPLLRGLGASTEVSEAGAGYLQMLMIGFPAAFLSGSLANTLRGLGNARAPFVCGLVANIVNVVLNYALIFGHLGMPEMGIVGSGLGTTISRFVGLGLMIILIRRGAVQGLVLRLRRTAMNRSDVGQILRVGLPAWLGSLAYFAAVTTLVWILARVDQTAVAAHGVGARLAALLQVPAVGMSTAACVLVGNSLGAGSPERARQFLRLACLAIAAIMLVIAVAIFVSAPWIAAVYDIRSGSLLEYTVGWLRLIALTLVPQGLMRLIEGLLLGAGAGRTLMKIRIIPVFLIQVPVAALLGFCTGLGPVGVWMGWPAAVLVQLSLAIIAYRRGHWATTGVRAAE